MKWILLLIAGICFSFYSFSQEDAWVYLTDKADVANSVANPLTILAQKAIDRKFAHGVGIDFRDVPVNEAYINQLKAQTGITVMAKSKWLNAVHVRGTDTDIKALSGISFISSIVFADKSLNTSKVAYKKQALRFQEAFTDFNYGYALNQIQMLNGDKLHLKGYTGEGMTVAILDGAFPNVDAMAAFQRIRMAGHILGTYDFVHRDEDVYTNDLGDPTNHGTLVFSTMAGYLQEAYLGTAPDASYYLFITEDNINENPVEESYWVEAVERADSLGVDVINSSLGYGSFYDNINYNYSPSEFDGQTAYVTKGANIAFEKGLLIVNSAGNEGEAGVNAPADAAGVFSIGAVDANGEYAEFSSIGSAIQPTQKPDVVAQGLASYVINENDAIGTANGTSFSSPIMAGGLVCLWQALPNRNNAQIMQLVRESASQYESPDNYLGYGIPDLQLALDTAIIADETTNEDGNVKLFPNPTDGMIYVAFPKDETELSVLIYDMLGKQVLVLSITRDESKMDVSSLRSGMYLAKILSKGKTRIFKIIKT